MRVITMGERGMVLVEPAGGSWHGAVAVRGSYPVGSGDAFLGGLLTALTEGEPWSRTAGLALGAAAANAEIPAVARLQPRRARELAACAKMRSLAT
jgi:sugar/nucleoside kinase (ribokinase family)